MVRPELIRRKLVLLRGYLQELERHREVALDDYVVQGGPRREVERLLQLIVDAAVDLNTHVVAETTGAPPPTYPDSFRDAARLGMIPAQLTEVLAPAVGLRNLIVHEYGGVEDARVHAAIPRALDDFSEFCASVTRWLEREHPDTTR